MPNTSFSTLMGISNAPIGSIAVGQFASNPAWLPCDGKEYLVSAYPLLDTTGLPPSFGTNAVTAKTLATNQVWRSCAYGNGIFVAVGWNASNAATTVANSSTDTTAWTNRVIPSGIYNQVIFANGKFVAVGNTCCATSTDGINWTAQTIPSVNYTNLCYLGGYFIALGAGNACSTSTDGIVWTARTMAGAGSDLMAVVGDKVFACVTASSVNQIQWSYDGIVWTVCVFGAATSLSFMYGFNGILYLQGNTYSAISVDGGVTFQVDGGSQLSYILNSNSRPIPGGIGVIGQVGAAWVITLDNKRFDAKGSTGQTYTAACMGGGIILMVGILGGSTNAAVLGVDTTKFRTPVYNKGDRAYIRVA